MRCIYGEEKQREIVSTLVEGIHDSLDQLPTEIKGTRETLWAYVYTWPRTELHALALAIKHPKFSEEKEWRIISSGPMMEDALGVGETPLGFREGRSMLIPYRRVPLCTNKTRFPLSEVVVGPNPNPEQSVRSVRSLLASHGLAHCNARRSDVPYRSW